MPALLLIGGYAVGLTIAAAVGRAVERVAGHRNRMLERTVRTVVLAGSLILALSQVGVDTTVVNLLIAGVVFATATVLAGISVVGGRQVAAHVAAGRVLQRVIEVGMQIEAGDVAGVVAELRVAHVLVDTDDGRILVPLRNPDGQADPYPRNGDRSGQGGLTRQFDQPPRRRTGPGVLWPGTPPGI